MSSVPKWSRLTTRPPPHPIWPAPREPVGVPGGAPNWLKGVAIDRTCCVVVAEGGRGGGHWCARRRSPRGRVTGWRCPKRQPRATPEVRQRWGLPLHVGGGGAASDTACSSAASGDAAVTNTRLGSALVAGTRAGPVYIRFGSSALSRVQRRPSPTHPPPTVARDQNRQAPHSMVEYGPAARRVQRAPTAAAFPVAGASCLSSPGVFLRWGREKGGTREGGGKVACLPRRYPLRALL